MRRVCVLLVAAALAAPAQEKQREPGRGVNLYSIEKEVALGRQLAAEVARQSKALDDPILGEFVNRIGQTVVRNSGARYSFTFTVLDSDQVNAFALPGGFVYLNSGLFEVAETEAELAGALAHEVAHVTARHGTRQATRERIANWASIPLVFMGGWGGMCARNGSNLAMPLGFLKMMRGFEEEADELGLDYMAAAGYDPAAAVDIFEKLDSLQRKKPGMAARLLETHPAASERIRKAQRHIEQTVRNQADFLVNTSEFTEARARLKALRGGRKEQPAPSLRSRPVPRQEFVP